MKQLHNIQLEILKKLLFAQNLKYTELKPYKEMENNQFDFHLDQLIKLGLVEKKAEGYSLSTLGKGYANTIDTEVVQVIKQAKIGVCVSLTRDINGEVEYLIYTRLKQPFYGSQGFLSGKVKYGEKLSDTAKREVGEETNLQGEPKMYAIIHYLIYDKLTNQLVEDKFLNYFNIHNPTGDLIPNEEGNYEWIKETEFKEKVTSHFVSYDEFLFQIDLIKSMNGDVIFKEVEQFTEKF